MKKYIFPLTCLCCALLQGCLSPEYSRPDMEQSIPATYKEENGWKTSSPQDSIDRGSWWTVFEDAKLNELMAQLNGANQSIAVAAANLRQARAQVAGARSAFLPTVGASGATTRGSSGNGAGVVGQSSVGVSAQWEISFWNAIPAYEGVKAQAAGSAADYATMKLAMQAELAQNYFQLRILDVQHDLYESTIAAYAKAVQLTRSQFQGGVVTPTDVAQAEAQLASAEAQLADLDRQRALLEHGIATLVGKIPSAFNLEHGQLSTTLPGVPKSIPSALLERRPDIASAERQVAVANEGIGLARAAWFPSLTLGGSSALQNGAAWLTAPVTVWSLGPSAALSLFEGGKRLADSDAAQAKYEGAVAQYRQTVLNAFKDVEDNLATLRYLQKEAEAQARAVAASQTALRLSLSQYRGGLTTYLQVVNTQTTALTNERTAISVQGQRLVAAVGLIKALGGGWDAAGLKELIQGPAPAEGVIER